MAPQQNRPPSKGGYRVHNEGDWGLQRALGQAVDGANPDLQLRWSVLDEQEKRDGWLEGGEDQVQEVGW